MLRWILYYVFLLRLEEVGYIDCRKVRVFEKRICLRYIRIGVYEFIEI